jgi:hypothetical protein
MQKVKALPYHRPPADCGWFYGPDYMVRISEEAAKKLLDPYPLPKVGNETVAADRVVNHTFSKDRLELTVANISGSYFLGSFSVPILYWKPVFGVEVDLSSEWEVEV